MWVSKLYTRVQIHQQMTQNNVRNIAPRENVQKIPSITRKVIYNEVEDTSDAIDNMNISAEE